MFGLFSDRPDSLCSWLWHGHVRQDIFDYIVSELGSLERMDEQIRSLMGNMLKKNLSNVGHATETLLLELGQI